MSTPRQALVDLMLDRWGGDDESKAEYEDAADAVLRVLAEHDEQQVREQVTDALFYASDERITLESDPSLVELVVAVMAVVARIVAARDVAVERADEAEKSLAAYRRGHDAIVNRAERAEADLAETKQRLEWTTRDMRMLEADLAAAQQQLDQVRAIVDDWKRQSVDHYETYGAPALVNLGAHASRIIQALDAPARPAGHDETG